MRVLLTLLFVLTLHDSSATFFRSPELYEAFLKSPGLYEDFLKNPQLNVAWTNINPSSNLPPSSVVNYGTSSQRRLFFVNYRGQSNLWTFTNETTFTPDTSHSLGASETPITSQSEINGLTFAPNGQLLAAGKIATATEENVLNTNFQATLKGFKQTCRITPNPLYWGQLANTFTDGINSIFIMTHADGNVCLFQAVNSEQSPISNVATASGLKLEKILLYSYKNGATLTSMLAIPSSGTGSAYNIYLGAINTPFSFSTPISMTGSNYDLITFKNSQGTYLISATSGATGGIIIWRADTPGTKTTIGSATDLNGKTPKKLLLGSDANFRDILVVICENSYIYQYSFNRTNPDVKTSWTLIHQGTTEIQAAAFNWLYSADSTVKSEPCLIVGDNSANLAFYSFREKVWKIIGSHNNWLNDNQVKKITFLDLNFTSGPRVGGSRLVVTLNNGGIYYLPNNSYYNFLVSTPSRVDYIYSKIIQDSSYNFYQLSDESLNESVKMWLRNSNSSRTIIENDLNSIIDYNQAMIILKKAQLGFTENIPATWNRLTTEIINDHLVIANLQSQLETKNFYIAGFTTNTDADSNYINVLIYSELSSVINGATDVSSLKYIIYEDLQSIVIDGVSYAWTSTTYTR